MAEHPPGAREPGTARRAIGPAAVSARRRDRRRRRRPGRDHQGPDRGPGRPGPQIKTLETQIAGQLAAHPDRHIFTSLPRAGTLRAARLLAEIGDCRSRFPDPWSLAALAGVAPVTRRSGSHIAHTFRWAVSRQLRGAVCDFAADSRHDSPWAAEVYRDARDRGKDHPHAVRILARAWIYVIWRCWQDGTAYDPAKHNAFQRVQDRQRTAQAEADR